MKKGLLALSLLLFARLIAREIVPGLVSFDEPAGFSSFKPSADPANNFLDLSRTITIYRPINDTTSRSTPARLSTEFTIGIMAVGYEIGNGKGAIYRDIDTAGVKSELAKVWSNSAIDPIVIKEKRISDRTAYFASYRAQVRGRVPEGDVYCFERYYIPINPNYGVGLCLFANSEEEISGLRELLKRISIPANAHVAGYPTPDEKKQSQINANLAIIAIAGQLVLTDRGISKIAFKELRKIFTAESGKSSKITPEVFRYVAPRLANLVPVDGENYDDLIVEKDKELKIRTRSFGEVQYPPKSLPRDGKNPQLN